MSDNLPTAWLYDTGSAMAEVRTILDTNGEPWWIASDVCKALGLEQVSQAVGRLDADERGVCILNLPPDGHPQTYNTINEPGLYSLVLRSTKPDAKRFKRWITHVVLPAIRKTGGYSVDGSIEELRSQLSQTLDTIRAMNETIVELVRQNRELSVNHDELSRTTVFSRNTLARDLADLKDRVGRMNGDPPVYRWLTLSDYCDEFRVANARRDPLDPEERRRETHAVKRILRTKGLAPRPGRNGLNAYRLDALRQWHAGWDDSMDRERQSLAHRQGDLFYFDPEEFDQSPSRNRQA